MAITLPRSQALGDAGPYQALNAVNRLRVTIAKNAGLFHADATANATTGDETIAAGPGALDATAATCSTADATDLASSIALASALTALANAHLADAIAALRSNAGAHLVADTTNGPIATTALATLADVEARANALKTAFNAHLSQASVHVNNDGTNTVTAANATDQTTANALLNAIKSAYNAHVQSAPAGNALQLVEC